MQRAVELHVGGQRYRVVSSASPEELERLARVVDDKIAAIVPPGRAITPQSMLLAAIALAHDLEEERRRSGELTRDTRGVLERIVHRVDEAIASVDVAVGQERAATRGASSSEAPTRSSQVPARARLGSVERVAPSQLESTAARGAHGALDDDGDDGPSGG